MGDLLTREQLEFAWPAGTVANVDTEYIVENGIDQAPPHITRLRMTHQMRVLQQGDERLIHYTNQARVDSSGDALRAVGPLLPLWVPTSVASDGGLLRRIEGVEQLRKLVAELVEPMLANAEQIPRFRESLKFITTEQGLYRIALEEWIDLVGRWHHMPLKNETLEYNGEVALEPGFTVPTTGTVSMISRAKCSRGREPRDCATFEYRSRIDRAGMEAATKLLFEGATARPKTAMHYRDYEMVIRVTLETQTMLPHEFTRTRTMHGVVEFDGRSSLTTDSERRHSQFTYIDAQ
jgi:hypothetical protein